MRSAAASARAALQRKMNIVQLLEIHVGRNADCGALRAAGPEREESKSPEAGLRPLRRREAVRSRGAGGGPPRRGMGPRGGRGQGAFPLRVRKQHPGVLAWLGLSVDG